jgi:hypothetical protein
MNRKDIIFLSVTTGSILIASILLTISLTYKSTRATTEQIATITFKRKTAQRKFFNQPVWELLYKDSPVYNKDKIRTSSDSLSIIHFDSETELELDENTLIYLDLSEGGTNITFEEGSIYTRNSKGSRISIITGDTRVDVEGANALLSVNNSDGSLNLNVTEGSARVITEGEEREVSQNETARISSEGVEVEEHPVRLELPRHNSYFVTPRNSRSISFSWSGEENNSKIFEIARDLNFSDVLSREELTSSTASFELEPGEYYWHITSSNGERLSAVYRCTILRDYPVTGGTPQNNSTYSYFRNTPPIYFNWPSSTLATSYTLEVSNERSFNEKTVSRNVTTPSLMVDTLEEGTYYWRVISVYGFGGSRSTLDGAVQTFQIVKNSSIDTPEQASPEPDYTISEEYFDRNQLTFIWNPNNDIPSYTLQVATDPSFTQIAYERETTTPNISLSNPLEPGNYYWRLSYFDAAADSTVYTDAQRFTITVETEIQQVYPRENNVESDDRTVRLRWDDTSHWGDYRVQISRDSSFQNPVQDFETRTTHADVTLPDDDTYHWRVFRVNRDGSNRSGSNTVSFNLIDEQVIVGGANFTFPEDGMTVSMDGENQLDLTWSGNSGPVILKLYDNESSTEVSQHRSQDHPIDLRILKN